MSRRTNGSVKDRLDHGGFLDMHQLADYFGVSHRTVQRRVASGDWPSSPVPDTRARRFSPADVARIEKRMGLAEQVSA
jgi:hypothetical protein